MKTVAEKIGIQTGSRVVLIDAPADAVDAIGLPNVVLESKLSGDFDYIHLFVDSQANLHEKFPALKSHLKSTGMLWVSWPKARRNGTDLTLTKVIEIGYDYGLVESKSISLNTTWSALKFTHPKNGKTYNNSYGKLPATFRERSI